MDNTQSEEKVENNSFHLKDYVDKNLLQAVTFGVVIVILGILFSSLFSFVKPDLPQECGRWNDYFVMEMTLFLIGFTVRYLLLSNSKVRKYLID